MNRLIQLHQLGQSVWLDFITRKFMADGKLEKLIREDGLAGVTSNPTIFQKAITGGSEYDEAIAVLVREGKNSTEVFDALAIQDIRRACDQFNGVYESSKGLDGYVSLEVNPHLARDTQRTLSEARRLFKEVNRPNVMIKIPGTREGLPAVTQAIAEGININITLIFALERYQEVIDAWLAGLEKWSSVNRGPCPVASVASFFVSRVDTLIDKRVENTPLAGKAAIANAVLAYDLFQKMKAGSRWQALAAQGAKIQRPLWASTSTKNPKYRDVIYVEELAGAETVNTLPLPTVDAFRDHGQARAALPGDVGKAKQAIADLQKAGIQMSDVTRQLEEEGLKLFADSFDELMKSLDAKREALKTSAR